MSKRLFITLDTEMDADTHWRKREPAEFSSILNGIPNIYRKLWDKYDICPIYFVSPEVVDNRKCCEVLKNEICKGAIIGAHLHPEHIEPQKENIDEVEIEKFPCFAYDYEIEKKKLENLRDLIKTNLGVTPIWYRAARFGADEDTIKILDELGFKYDSSFTPNVNWSDKGGPNHSGTPVFSYKIKGSNIIEYPISIAGKRGGVLGKVLPENWLFYRWLRPTHMSYLEEKNLIDELTDKGINDLVMMFHSMEIMINKTPYVRNKYMQKYYLWRLEKTIRYVKKKGYVTYRLEEKL